jgi:hypothetical protein
MNPTGSTICLGKDRRGGKDGKGFGRILPMKRQTAIENQPVVPGRARVGPLKLLAQTHKSKCPVVSYDNSLLSNNIMKRMPYNERGGSREEGTARVHSLDGDNHCWAARGALNQWRSCDRLGDISANRGIRRWAFRNAKGSLERIRKRNCRLVSVQ